MDRGNELLKESVVMANELDVAGEFIYAAIDKFNKMNNSFLDLSHKSPYMG